MEMIPFAAIATVALVWWAVNARGESSQFLGELHQLDPMVVELRDTPPRHLRTVVVLEASAHADVGPLSGHRHQATDAVASVLGARYFREINGARKRYVLKQRIVEAVNTALGAEGVRSAYFVEFRLDSPKPLTTFRNPFK
jgi:flagellar basal body-associated protein FliL